MAHFAKIENGIVTNLDGTWVQTSFNARIRGKFAGIGDIYDSVNDVFVQPIPEEPEAPETEEVVPE